MITFFVCLVCLIAGNFFYGKFLERRFGADPARQTPLKSKSDGVDFIEIKTWKMFVIQFLNIAGLGPIFGAMMGAAYGPMAFVWIVLGNIFFGAMHDYMAGMLSLRGGGANVPVIVGEFLGKHVRGLLMIVTVFLLVATGVSFVTGPVGLLTTLTGWNSILWLVVIFAYYFIATILPINKIIGRIYPYFGALLIFMAVAILGAMLVNVIGGNITMPEIGVDSFRNFHSNPDKNILVPMLFVVISCGALSGFHATQSPLMARCMANETQGRKVFHAAMACEGVVALIWATAAIAYFGGAEALNARMDAGASTAVLVNEICNSWLGRLGAVLAIIGIVVCPITTGDTAMRSLRLVIADAFHIDQKKVVNRLLIAVPCFALVIFLTKMKFEDVWTLVGISNQFMATIMLWTISVYFKSRKPGKAVHLISSIPATVMTFIVVSYIIVAPHQNGGLGLDLTTGRLAGVIVALGIFVFFLLRRPRVVWSKEDKSPVFWKK